MEPMQLFYAHINVDGDHSNQVSRPVFACEVPILERIHRAKGQAAIGQIVGVYDPEIAETDDGQRTMFPPSLVKMANTYDDADWYSYIELKYGTARNRNDGVIKEVYGPPNDYQTLSDSQRPVRQMPREDRRVTAEAENMLALRVGKQVLKSNAAVAIKGRGKRSGKGSVEDSAEPASTDDAASLVDDLTRID